MQNATKYIFNSVLFVAIILVLDSCKKLVQIQAPVSQLTPSQVFTDDNTATAAISAIYAKFNYTYAITYSPTLTGSFSADELNDFTSTYTAYSNNNIQANDGIDESLWSSFYNIIYQTNSLLEGLQSSNGVTQDTKNQLTDEGLFLRAFCYFELINIYGDVPLLLTTDVTITAVAPRTPVTQIYQQIISDLKNAQNSLNDTYVTSGRVRVNQSSVTALLARVYLYTQDWADAEAQATKVIGDGQYSLDSNLNNVFIENSSETILQIWTQGFTYLGQEIIPGSTSPNYVFTNDFMDSIEPSDKRRIAWMDSIVYVGTTYFYPFKYKQKAINSSANAEYLMLLRFSEQYLIRAEARAEENKNFSGAISDLNVIRTRAGLSGTNASTQAELLLAIEKERRIELFTEWGHRWFDLKRTGRVNTVLGAEKGATWKPDDALYPVPLVEISANPALTQNAGY